MTTDKATLLTASFGVEEIELPGGMTVKVRALSRAEALEVQGKEIDKAELECKLISSAMVEPTLTADEVEQWQRSSPAGVIQAVADAIIRLSGMEKAAQKAAYQQFR